MEDPLKSSVEKKIRGRCIINGCVNHSSRMIIGQNPSYYHIPKAFFAKWKAERRLAWIKAIIRHNKYSPDWQPTKTSILCNLHFVGGVKSEHPLHPSYNPTLFPGPLQTMKANCAEKAKPQVQVADLRENKELKDQTKTVERAPKRRKVEKKKADSRPTVVLLRKNFVEPPVDVEEIVILSNDVGCQVEFETPKQTSESLVNCMICNLKTENNMNCAETQVNMIKNGHVNGESAKSGNSHKSSTKRIGVSKGLKIEFTGLSSINSNNSLMGACGLNFEQFHLILRDIPDITRNLTFVNNKNRLLIALIKLRHGLSDSALAVYFSMQQTLIHDIFDEILPFLFEFAEDRVGWIEKEIIQNNLPESFKPDYSNCRAMIDCIDIQIELPESAEALDKYYRSFRNFNTFKVFIACAPNGFIMYKSDCYGGRKTDDFLAHDCEFLELIEPGDLILTDREFPNLEVALNNKDASLKMIDVNPDSNLFTAYMHMRKSLNLLKHFKILSSMPVDQIEDIDEIVQICCSLVNLNCIMGMSQT